MKHDLSTLNSNRFLYNENVILVVIFMTRTTRNQDLRFRGSENLGLFGTRSVVGIPFTNLYTKAFVSGYTQELKEKRQFISYASEFVSPILVKNDIPSCKIRPDLASF